MGTRIIGEERVYYAADSPDYPPNGSGERYF
jgi:hypothetical protein